jgi:hypothetical protein
MPTWSYDPREYNDLLKRYDWRFCRCGVWLAVMGGNPHRHPVFWHSIGNKMLTFFSNMFSNLNLTDMETCY